MLEITSKARVISIFHCSIVITIIASTLRNVGNFLLNIDFLALYELVNYLDQLQVP